MDTREYELVLLLPKDADKKIVDEVKKVIGDKGKVGEVREEGVKPLSYPIKKQTQADYVSIFVSLSSDGISSLDKTLRLNQQILRYLLLRKEGPVRHPSVKLRTGAQGKKVSEVPKVKLVVKKSAGKPKKHKVQSVKRRSAA